MSGFCVRMTCMYVEQAILYVFWLKTEETEPPGLRDSAAAR